MELNEKIRKIRLAHHITQEELAAITNLGHTTIRKYETGERKPKMEQLLKIANALGVSINYFLDLDINTTSDLLSLIFKMNQQLDIRFDADLDSQGQFIPESVKISFLSDHINQKLCSYMFALQESKTSVDKDSQAEYLSHIESMLLDDQTDIQKGLSEQAEIKSHIPSDTATETIATNTALYNLLKDCSQKEMDIILKAAKFTKQVLRENV